MVAAVLQVSFGRKHSNGWAAQLETAWQQLSLTLQTEDVVCPSYAMSEASTIQLAIGCTCLVISHSDHKRAAFQNSDVFKADGQVVSPRDLGSEGNLVSAWRKLQNISWKQDCTPVQDICSDVCFATEDFAKLIICFQGKTVSFTGKGVFDAIADSRMVFTSTRLLT